MKLRYNRSALCSTSCSCHSPSHLLTIVATIVAVVDDGLQPCYCVYCLMPSTRSNTRLGHTASSPDFFASSPDPPSRRTRTLAYPETTDVIIISSDDEDVAPVPRRSATRSQSTKAKGKQRAHATDHVVDVEVLIDKAKGTKRKGSGDAGSSSERDPKRAKEVCGSRISFFLHSTSGACAFVLTGFQCHLGQ